MQVQGQILFLITEAILPEKPHLPFGTGCQAKAGLFVCFDIANLLIAY